MRNNNMLMIAKAKHALFKPQTYEYDPAPGASAFDGALPSGVSTMPEQ